MAARPTPSGTSAPPPYVPADQSPAEFTPRAVLLGTILENNVVQTTASAGDSLAAGIAFTIPALIFLGYDPSGFRIFLLAATAGLLGVVMLIPLRHELTIAEHDRLPFPEGTACATVLIAGDRGRTAARPVFIGIALGAAYQLASRGLQLWNQSVFVSVASLHKMSFGAELSPLFLGVGYLVGARVAAIMLAGGLLAWMVLIPLFDAMAGSAAGTALGLPPDLTASTAQQIWSTQVRFVGSPSAPFEVSSSLPSALFNLNLGLTVMRSDNLHVRFDYNGQFGSSYRSNGGSLKLSYLF